MAVGSGVSKPESGNTVTRSEWDEIAASKEFRELLAAKSRFIVPATFFFIIYYFALPVLVGYAPQLKSTPVIGVLNWAYLFALSQFLVAWLIAFLYVRATNKFDRMGSDVLTKFNATDRKASR